VIDFRGEPVIYKQFKKLLSTDGRVESEIAMASVIPADARVPVLQQIRGIILDPLAVVYAYPKVEQKYRSLGKPPSLKSCTRDTYPKKRKFEPEVACRTLYDVACGLLKLHAFNIVHGDLYAHNIQYDNLTGNAMLIDLGAAWTFTDAAVANLDVRSFKVLVKELKDLSTAPDHAINNVLFKVLGLKDMAQMVKTLGEGCDLKPRKAI
jgi:hypothetical protein